MKLVAPFALLMAVVGLAEASSLYGGFSDLQGRHNKIARQHQPLEGRSDPVVVARRSNSKKKRCSVKAKVCESTFRLLGGIDIQTSGQASASVGIQNVQDTPETPTPSPSKTKDSDTPKTTKAAEPASTPKSSSSSGGLIQVTSSVCGGNRATSS